MKIGHSAQYESKCKLKCYCSIHLSTSMLSVHALMPNIVATLLTNNVRRLVFSFGL